MEGLSNSDVALLANRDRDGIFGGDSMMWFLAILLLIGGGNGFFGKIRNLCIGRFALQGEQICFKPVFPEDIAICTLYGFRSVQVDEPDHLRLSIPRSIRVRIDLHCQVVTFFKSVGRDTGDVPRNDDSFQTFASVEGSVTNRGDIF